MENYKIRINQLEKEAEYLEAIVAKLQIDAAQVVGKDKLIQEMDVVLSHCGERIDRLEAEQRILIRRIKKLTGEVVE